MESPQENPKGPKDPDELEIIKNKDKYIALNEKKEQTEDVTEEISNFIKTLKQGQMLSTEDFTLESTMSAIEINHYKMDPHCHNEKVSTYKSLIKKKAIKPIDELDIEESLILINSLFKRELSWICGGSIQQNLFSLIYFSDDSINQSESTSICRTFLYSILQVLYLSYSNIGECSCLRDEDFSCVYYPNAFHLKRENIINDIKNIEQFLHSKLCNENKKIIEQLINRFNIQKILITILSEQFDTKNNSRYDNLIIYVNELKSEINLIDLTLEPKIDSFDLDTYFNPELYKIFPTLANNKKGEMFDNEKAIEKLNAFIQSLNSICFIYEISNIYHLYPALYNLNIKSPSFIIREIVDINLFPNGSNLLFSKFDMKESLKETFKQLKIPMLEEEIFSYIIATQKDLCKRKLKNQARIVREAKEIIDNLTAVAIEGHKKETAMTSNSKINKTILTNFLLKTVLSEMFNTINVNFEIDMFKVYELDYVFYICEQIVNQLTMHNFVIASKYAEKVLKENNIAESSLKKKFSNVQKMILDETYIYKSLKVVYNSLKLFIYHIKEKKLIKIPKSTEKEIQLKILNRFPYFKNCSMFMNLTYEAFTEDINEEIKDENYFTNANANMKICVSFLKELRGADAKLRDYTSYDNDFIDNLNKAIIFNSLIFRKVTKKEEQKTNDFMNVKLNMKKYNTFLPIIEIQ